MFASIRGGSCAPVAALLLALALPGVAPVAVVRGAEPAAEAAAGPLEMLAAAKRICILGDSITYDGRWVSALSAWMEAKGLTGDVIAVGLPSETCSGPVSYTHLTLPTIYSV